MFKCWCRLCSDYKFAIRVFAIIMVVIVAFERPSIPFFRKHFPNVYRDAFLIVGSGTRVAWFDTEPKELFHSRRVNDLEMDNGIFDFVALKTSPDEDVKILRACDACCECRIQYNLLDQFLRSVPFWNPIDCSLYDTRQMYGAQSVVLILRECLSEPNPLRPVMLAINSRSIEPRRLKKDLSDFGYAIPASYVQGSLSACRAGAVSGTFRV